jgi:1-acyl-sn-glycerol-3-phosphate acyltransferase
MQRFENKRFYFYATPVRRLVTAIVRGLFPLFGRLQAEGVEHLPSEGPVVLAANHLSEYDMFPMQLAIPRPIFFMSKVELFRNPFMDILLRQLGAFPVQRGARDEQALRYALRVLEEGQVLGIFPGRDAQPRARPAAGQDRGRTAGEGGRLPGRPDGRRRHAKYVQEDSRAGAGQDQPQSAIMAASGRISAGFHRPADVRPGGQAAP